MALMILAHPYYDLSVANKKIIQELQQHNLPIEIRDIYHLYANSKINVRAEQEALLRHDLIILQFPMFWINMPGFLQMWLDSIFTRQFVESVEGKKLKNKKILLSLTVGQTESNFNIDKLFSFDSFLFSIQKSTNYAQMDYLNPVCLYGVSLSRSRDIEKVQVKAKKHSQKLINIIRDL